jgi:hypothetical protein
MLCTTDSVEWTHLYQAVWITEEVSTSSEHAPMLRYAYTADLGFYFTVVYKLSV